MSVNITFLTMIVFLLPMFYLLLASPAFLFVRLDIPQVARLLRAMFFGYFRVLVVVGLISASLNVLYGRLIEAGFIALITVFALVWRHWMMRRFDALVGEIQAGNTGVSPRLRHLHWLGMAANAAQIATTIALIPSLVSAA
jgi:hypothetical protein